MSTDTATTSSAESLSPTSATASRPRHFTDLILAVGQTIDLPESISHHISRVTRMRAGDLITLFNGDGYEYVANISAFGKKNVQVQVTSRASPAVESPISIVLLQCLSGGDNMAYSIEKSVELGVIAVLPVKAERSVLQLTAERADKKLAHWTNIARASAAQCGRTQVPCIHAIQELKNCTAWMQATYPNHRLIAIHPDGDTSLVKVLSAYQSSSSIRLGILVGPEGGFDAAEIGLLTSSGITLASLGPRVLRTETAGPTAIATAQALCGDF